MPKLEVLRGESTYLNSQPIVDGQMIFTPDTSELYIDMDDTIEGVSFTGRYKIGGGGAAIYEREFAVQASAWQNNSKATMSFAIDNVAGKMFTCEFKLAPSANFAAISAAALADISVIAEPENNNSVLITLTANGTIPTVNIPFVFTLQEHK